MKVSHMPLPNKLQAIETILDREIQQKHGPSITSLRLALRIIRAAQRELCGKRYVTERSLRSFAENYNRLSKTNYPKWKRERSLLQNQKLMSHVGTGDV